MIKGVLLSSFQEVARRDWDGLLRPDDAPFLDHTFLCGLEQTGCATKDTGWIPRPAIAVTAEGHIVGAAPSWIKTHSMGEFVYDQAWAEAAHGAGYRYYPKWVVGVPFTPVAGRRLLVHPDHDPAEVHTALLQAMTASPVDATGIHVLFHPPEEAREEVFSGCFPRLQYQFHWHNKGYRTFDAFLEQLSRRTRKMIRRERREVSHYQIACVDAPSPDQLDHLHRFYARTCHQFGPWGRVYLTREFFQYLGEHWAHRLHAVLASEQGRVVAGAFNVRHPRGIYGRYWGCEGEHKFLHFEVCYYAIIDYAIREGLQFFEPGHGGSHKYRRGFEPHLTWSSHQLFEPRLHDGLARHTEAERAYVRDQVRQLREHTAQRRQ